MTAGPPPLRVVVGVGLVAGVTLALQVLLTRLLSAVFLYHFAFLVISLALLGTGGGALFVYVRERRRKVNAVDSLMARFAIGFGVFLVVLPEVLSSLHYGSSGVAVHHVSASFVITLSIACVAAAIPFLAAGIVIALAVTHYVRWIGRVYAFDLCGAALGSIAIVPLLWLLDAPALAVGLAAVAGIAGALFGWSSPRLRLVSLGIAAVALVLAVLSETDGLFAMPVSGFPTLGTHAVAERWTPLSRVVGYAPASTTFAGMSYDRDGAPVPVYHRGEPPLGWRTLGLGPQSIPYAITPPGRTLVIGGGGGRDIHNALSAGQPSVDVIELNRGIVQVVDHDLRRWSGSPYTLPHVHTVTGDGRSTLAARSTKYQHINIGFTNTLGTSAGASYALAEANLYTVEAVDEYLDHVLPGGTLAITRLYRFSGEEALRATVLMLAAVRRYGIQHPERNVVVILQRGPGGEILSGTVIAQLHPFTAAQLSVIRKLAPARDGLVAFAPGGPYWHEWAQLARAPSVDSFCQHYSTDVCAPTDNQPFFFQAAWPLHPSTWDRGYVFTPTPFVVLIVALGILVVLGLLAFVLPLFGARSDMRPTGPSLLFFAAIGLGFLSLEIVLVQRFVLFLGFPTYALSVVLFSLLLFTGAGALISARWAAPRRPLTAALALATALMISAIFGLQPLLEALIGAPFAVRVLITVALLAPAGLTLGTAMPVGLRRLTGLHAGGTAWAWGINGIASVLASVLAIAVAIAWGFSAATGLAAGCYLVALGHAACGRWPESLSGRSGVSSRSAQERQAVRSLS
jgi:hypothetical protein